jgi:hypothetical protein
MAGSQDPIDLLDLLPNQTTPEGRARQWRQVIILTYSFDLPFFEAIILPTLWQGGVRSIVVAADAQWLSERLCDWLEAGEVRHAGQRYALCSVAVPGSFHPKLVLATGPSSGMVLVGSGNISEYGMAKGGELFTHYEWGGKSSKADSQQNVSTGPDIRVPSLAQEAWQLCRTLSEKLSIDPLFAQQVNMMGASVPAITLPPSSNHLAHNLKTTVLDQLVNTLEGKQVVELLVWAPYWDKQLNALTTLLDRLHPQRVTLAVQPGITNLSGARFSEVIAQHPGIEWSLVQLHGAKQIDAVNEPMLHAKGILVSLDNGEEVLLAGSPNISTRALLKTASTGNFEIGLLGHGRRVRPLLFSDDGYAQLGDDVDPAYLEWHTELTSPVGPGVKSAMLLVGASWSESTLTLQAEGTWPNGATVVVNNKLTFPIVHISTSGSAIEVDVDLPEDIRPRTVFIQRGSWTSHVVCVLDISSLAAYAQGAGTSGRLVNSPIEAFEFGGDAEIIDCLKDLASVTVISTYDLQRLHRGQGMPSDQEEEAEAAGSAKAVRLEDIDFARLSQHPKLVGYRQSPGGLFASSSIELWLDAIIKQFRGLGHAPVAYDDRGVGVTELDEELQDDEELIGASPNVRWEDLDAQVRAQEQARTKQRAEEELKAHKGIVTKRARRRVLNRMRRYIRGLDDPDFWRRVPPYVMAANYSVFIRLLNVMWKRTADAATAILPVGDLVRLSADILSGFWGSDLYEGYITRLSEDEALDLGVMVEENNGDAYTLAVCNYLLALTAESANETQFVVAGVAKAMDSVCLLEPDAARRAVEKLEQDLGKAELDALDPLVLLDKVKATKNAFSWDRYCRVLETRFGLRNVSRGVRKSVGGISGVRKAGYQGSSLFVESDRPMQGNRLALAVLTDWIETERGFSPDPIAYHLIWGVLSSNYQLVEETLIYLPEDKELLFKPANSTRSEIKLLAAGIEPVQFSQVDFQPGIVNSVNELNPTR